MATGATWVSRNQAELQKVRAYIENFPAHKPAVFRYFQGGTAPIFPMSPQSDQGTALLLCFCALYQNIEEEKLAGLLERLWGRYGTDVFRLNKLPFEALQKEIHRFPGLANWALVEKAPGILRSLCDFFFKHGSLHSWVYGLKDGEACVRVLADEIFLMGKTSPFKSKPRFFLWLLTQLEGSRPELFWTNRTMLPLSPGHVRFLRQFGPLKTRKAAPWSNPEAKLDYFNRFCRMLFPDRPWITFTPLSDYLQTAKTDHWMCRLKLGGCLQCPLVADCPGRVI